MIFTDLISLFPTGHTGVWSFHLKEKISWWEFKKTQKDWILLENKFLGIIRPHSPFIIHFKLSLCFTITVSLLYQLRKCFILICCTDMVVCQTWVLLHGPTFCIIRTGALWRVRHWQQRHTKKTSWEA